MTLPRRLSAQKLLRAHGLSPKHSWGQNFLEDSAMLARIAAATKAGPDDVVVELGAGLGALTHALLERGQRVIAFERDPEMVAVLHALFDEQPLFQLRAEDIGYLDFNVLQQELQARPIVVGNLPYQLSSRLVVSLANQAAAVQRVVVMLQLEVAERLTAEPGSKAYGLLSVLAQRAFHVQKVCRVGRQLFYPAPRVDSAVVCLEPRASEYSENEDRWLVAAARAVFHTRRKMLRNSLKNGLGIEMGLVDAALVAAKLDPQCRAEELSVDDIARLGQAFHRLGVW